MKDTDRQRQHKEEKAVKEKEDEEHRQTRQHKEEKAVKEKEDEGHR